MSRVLLLSYHFPPVGGAGVQRVLKFARYLPESGFTPVVVTGPIGSTERWTPVDQTLESELSGAIEIRRIAGPEPVSSGGLQDRAERWLRREKWTDWWINEAVVTGRLVEDVDVLLCSMSPFQSAVAAMRLSHKLSVPWVADLRDPWALDEMMVYQTRVHRWLELRLMRRTLGTASAIIMNTEAAADALQERFPEFRHKCLYVIPNGYDASDFADPIPSRSDDLFRIVHTGYLHTDVGLANRGMLRRLLGGGVGEVEILTRSHVYLLRAIDQVSERDPGLGARIELHLAGVLSREDREAIGAHAAVRVRDYLPHAAAIELIRSADLLFLPMHDLPPGRRATIVPGKTYEYLASGRPILAALPDGDARDLLAEAGGSYLCRPTDVELMASMISALARGEEVPLARDRELVAHFERRELTRRLAQVLEATCRGPSSKNAARERKAAASV